jgi:hypothetical protein
LGNQAWERNELADKLQWKGFIREKLTRGQKKQKPQRQSNAGVLDKIFVVERKRSLAVFYVEQVALNRHANFSKNSTCLVEVRRRLRRSTDSVKLKLLI